MMRDNTHKYLNMIESFECDFSLAEDEESEFTLNQLQEKLKKGDRSLLRDVELLKRLSYGLRNNKIMIIEED